MELNFNVKTDENKKEYLRPGLHDVLITGLIEVAPETGSPYIEITVINDEGQHSERLYTSKAAQEYTMEKLQKICLAVGLTKEQIEAMKTVVELNKALAGKEVEFKLSGQEVETEKGRFLRSYFGLGKFVAAKGSKTLKFVNNDKGTKGDIKWLIEEAKPKTGDPSDKLPF